MNKAVLVVEDEPLIAHMVSECLADAGLAVTVVDDGDEALALIEGGARFDALVTDIKFPGKTCGWDLARSARMRSPTIEVFYTTGHGEVEWLREGVARSVLVPKPFLPYVLASEVGAVLSPEWIAAALARPRSGGYRARVAEKGGFMGHIKSAAMLAAGLAAASAVHPTRAQTGQEQWAPFSTTAMSITGDIALSPKELRAAGHAFPLALAADLPQYDSLAGKVPARVLKVTKPTDPPLLNGNRLGCGTPIRWIVVFRYENGAKLGLDVFDGPDMPRSEKNPTLCAIFTYARR